MNTCNLTLPPIRPRPFEQESVIKDFPNQLLFYDYLFKLLVAQTYDSVLGLCLLHLSLSLSLLLLFRYLFLSSPSPSLTTVPAPLFSPIDPISVSQLFN